MLSSHETCPICGKGLLHSKKLNQPCAVVDNKKMSFVESICNTNNTDINQEFPHHIFFQVTSLYGELLYQKIDLIKYNCEVDINYTSHSSQLKYLKPSRWNEGTQTWQGGQIDVVPLENFLLDFDYPKLEKIIKKVKTLAPFL